MAVITSKLTTIWTCETITNAVGNKPELDPEIYKEGANSVAFNSGTVGSNMYVGFDGTIPNGGDMSVQHMRFWYTSIVFANISSYATGGIRFYIKDSTGNESYWYIAGNDTYYGGWINICVYGGATPDANNGTIADNTDVVELGVYHNFSTSPKNQINTWVDFLHGIIECSEEEPFWMHYHRDLLRAKKRFYNGY